MNFNANHPTNDSVAPKKKTTVLALASLNIAPSIEDHSKEVGHHESIKTHNVSALPLINIDNYDLTSGLVQRNEPYDPHDAASVNETDNGTDAATALHIKKPLALTTLAVFLPLLIILPIARRFSGSIKQFFTRSPPPTEGVTSNAPEEAQVSTSGAPTKVPVTVPARILVPALMHLFVKVPQSVSTAESTVETQNRTTSEDFQKEGNECYDAGSYQEAIDMFGKAIELDKKDVMNYVYRAEAYMRSVDFLDVTREYPKGVAQSARNDYLEAIRINPEYIKVIINRCMGAGDTTQALFICDQGLQNDSCTTFKTDLINLKAQILEAEEKKGKPEASKIESSKSQEVSSHTNFRFPSGLYL